MVRAVGDGKLEHGQAQIERIELDGFDRRGAAERLGEPGLELRADDRRYGQPCDQDQGREAARHEGQSPQPAEHGRWSRYRSCRGNHRQLGRWSRGPSCRPRLPILAPSCAIHAIHCAVRTGRIEFVMQIIFFRRFA